MSFDPAIPLLSIYPDKTMFQKDTCTPRFIASLFTIAKTWKHSKCPWTDEWVKKIWCIYTIEFLSAIKEKLKKPFAAAWMDLEVIMLIEVSKRVKDKYRMISPVYGN